MNDPKIIHIASLLELHHGMIHAPSSLRHHIYEGTCQGLKVCETRLLNPNGKYALHSTKAFFDKDS